MFTTELTLNRSVDEGHTGTRPGGRERPGVFGVTTPPVFESSREGRKGQTLQLRQRHSRRETDTEVVGLGYPSESHTPYNYSGNIQSEGPSLSPPLSIFDLGLPVRPPCRVRPPFKPSLNFSSFPSSKGDLRR